MTALAIVVAALAIEAAIGYPAPLLRAIRHPVMWFGALISLGDRWLNAPTRSFHHRRIAGVAGLLVLLLATVAPAAILQHLVLTHLASIPAILLLGLLGSSLLAQRSLWSHVRAVADALDQDGLAAGRQAVGHIVGRNPDQLDASGVVRAAIESLAENFSDAVVAPAIWGAAFGLPGLVFYKAINTADSMIGHRTERHAAYGWAAARLDDLVNLPASRLAALWILLAALLHRNAALAPGWRAMWRDAAQHRSPNAGWPEAALAGALGIRIGGPRTYGQTLVHVAWMGHGRETLTVADLHRALALYRTACALQLAVALAALAALWG